MLLILFGLSGAGKNFVGEILGKEFGYYFWDADTEISQDMRACILNKQLITQEMRDELTKMIALSITKLKDQYSNIVISQALYKEKNRHQIALLYPDANFILIKATQENIQNRLRQRNDWVDLAYAEKMRLDFEEPKQVDSIIINDIDAAAVISQLRDFLKQKSE